MSKDDALRLRNPTIFNPSAQIHIIFAHLATLKSRNSKVDNLLKDTTETESEGAEKSSWDQANRVQKLGLVRRNRKKISKKLKGHI
jgi:hypothetical protein